MFSLEILSLEALHQWFEVILGFRDLQSGRSGVPFGLGAWRPQELREDCSSELHRKTNAGQRSLWKECRRGSKITMISISK